MSDPQPISVFRAVQLAAVANARPECDAESHLRNFASASVVLLNSGSAEESVLSGVFPTLVQSIGREAARGLEQIRAELTQCEADSQQLKRLALIHCGADAGSLLEKLDWGQRQVSRIIESLEALHAAAVAQNPFEMRSADRCFLEFCQATLQLLEGGDGDGAGSVVSRLMPSLIHALRDCSQERAGELRGELATWESQSLKLVELARTYSREEAARLCEHLDETLTQAALLISSLESLQPENGPTATTPVPNSVASPAAESAVSRAETLCQMAANCARQNDFETAEKLYSDALLSDPQHAAAHIHRGRMRLIRGAIGLAVDDFTRGLEIDTEDSQGYAWRGDAYALAGRLDAALQDYERSLQLAPGPFVVRYNRAVAMRQKGMLDAALVEINDLIDQKPDHAALYLNRGIIHQSRDNLPAAADDYRIALRYQPESQEAAQRLRNVTPLIDAPSAPESDSVLDLPDFDLLESAAVEQSRPAPRPSRSADTEPGLSADDIAAVLAEPEQTIESAAEKETVGHGSGVLKSTAETPQASSQDDIFDKYALDFECPKCGEVSKVRWNRLQSGKVLSCPRCRSSFTSTANGKMLQVVRARDGRWRTMRETWLSSLKNKLLVGAASAAVVLMLIFIPGMRSTPRDDEGLPPELEPRSKLFAVAWLKGDFRRMRQLTDPESGSQLYMWCLDHPAPAIKGANDIERRLQMNVVMLPTPETGEARVNVQFAGLDEPSNKVLPQLALAWKQDGERWLFRPDLRAVVDNFTR